MGKRKKREGRKSRGAGSAKSAAVSPIDACDALARMLEGDTRRHILDTLVDGASFSEGLVRVKEAMRRHTFPTPDGRVALGTWVRELDRRTRREGFRVLQAWDHRAQRFTSDDVPVLLLDYYEYLREGEGSGRTSPAILLDFYVLHLLALVVMRAWDSPDPDGIFDRVERLVSLLQGEGGSGHHFVDSAGMLVILAVSQFHPREAAYDELIERVRGLSPRHRLGFARVSAGVLGAHLRWGHSQMYSGDVPRMRADNMGDYPWLLFTAATLTDAFVTSGADAVSRPEIAADLWNALTADPGAFAGSPPEAFTPYLDEYERFRTQFTAAASELRPLFAELRPTAERYSPPAFYFNFPHNTVVAATTVALLEQSPAPVPFDDLMVARPEPAPDGSAPGLSDARWRLARGLMDYAGARPERLEARGARLILYDTKLAQSFHDAAMEQLFGD